ncbi:MAG TPA: SAM-dependent methyltransferase [Trebonia sp.]|nr:SAM-dependent methyltransferase [Trebonia sp.]
MSESSYIDTSKPNIARMYDYWLGGKDNYEADRKAADAVQEFRPAIAEQALDNKRFLTRAVGYVAAQGVRQFLDVGAGLPTSPTASGTAGWVATHRAAEQVVAEPVVAYVDYDPVAVAHSRALLIGGAPHVVAVNGDMHDPAAILADDDIRAAGLDLTAPACVILACVLHFVDAGTARDIVSGFTAALARGSYLLLSVGFARADAADFATTYNSQNGARIYAHSWDQITGFFDGLDLVPPGVVDSADWQPGAPQGGEGPAKDNFIAAAVARVPSR